jgi:hypothetical protein
MLLELPEAVNQPIILVGFYLSMIHFGKKSAIMHGTEFFVIRAWVE